jgi:hypothetical protein
VKSYLCIKWKVYWLFSFLFVFSDQLKGYYNNILGGMSAIGVVALDERKETGGITISVNVKNGWVPLGRRQKRLIDCRKRLKILSWFNIATRDLVGDRWEERLIVTMASSTFPPTYVSRESRMTLLLIISKMEVLLHRANGSLP